MKKKSVHAYDNNMIFPIHIIIIPSAEIEYYTCTYFIMYLGWNN